MLVIKCPYCGKRSQNEFAYGGDANLNRPELEKEISEENILEIAIESGADECISNDNFHEVHCEMSEVYNVKKKLESMIQNFIFAGLEWKPLNNVQVSKNKLEATTVFLETLEDNDDVQSVYTNLKFINN